MSFPLRSTDQRKQMGAAGREKMEKEFDREKVINDTLKAIGLDRNH